MAILRPQFEGALSRIEVNGEKRQRAIDAHTEIQELLSADEYLQAWGINTCLIGSYSRHTAIYPGKDVDVFARLSALDTSANPGNVYGRVETVLVEQYGRVENGGRVTSQARSVKVDFPDSNDHNAAFAVDAVPAVRNGERWAIPTKDQYLWVPSAEGWVTTDPERFGQLSSDLSTADWSPTVSGQDAYKPVVKLVRQARRNHLGDRRPGGLYVEFATYDVWSSGVVTGEEWDHLFAATLRKLANRFQRAPYEPLIDPGLGTPVEPALDANDWFNASNVFERLANLAEDALSTEKCRAAVKWREILGENDRGQVFPLPPGCDANGFPLSAVGGASIIRPKEAARFG